MPTQEQNKQKSSEAKNQQDFSGRRTTDQAEGERFSDDQQKNASPQKKTTTRDQAEGER